MRRIVLASFVFAAALSSADAQTFSLEDLTRRAIERRAVETVNWGITAVNFDRMLQAAIHDAGAGVNQVVYWSRFLDSNNQTLTPNPDTIYLQPFFDTRDVGPIVIEIPPAEGGSITGTIMDAWQAALEDVGPAGVDKGKGGKYLILPPGFAGTAPSGYIVLPSMTYQGYALLRSAVKGSSDADVADAVVYGKRIRLYPLSQAGSQPETKFVDAAGRLFDSRIPYDLRFFQSLDRFVQAEPWLERDKAMIDPLRSVGIEKGKPFAPNDATKQILEGAAKEAQAWLSARYETAFPPYFPGRQWAVPAAPELMEVASTFYEKPNTYTVDARGLTDYWAFSTVKHLGAGQFYLMGIRDKDGQPLEGAGTYRLTVPADAPVSQYWSAVVYSRETHTLIRGASRLSRSSLNPELQRNGDGSVDLYFAPKAPAGKEANWVATDPASRFEVLFRLYGPRKPLFEKTWILTDVEKVD
ncbi:DUF1254 domain-containing protein [Methylobacterium sp. P1-11]|uniref:DUF1254 domain-containing protein n=1 Tax=Methylobacterium sp. P1-11 TaxID=2024616 RepID=UPI0011EE5E26|nr:DUF1254 domain-containing protein [Methylobacterium sp. P1-11]KAA0121887.1 DUF1254 domain-containing protein [Methylobacterium sp. P1-11]